MEVGIFKKGLKIQKRKTKNIFVCLLSVQYFDKLVRSWTNASDEINLLYHITLHAMKKLNMVVVCAIWYHLYNLKCVKNTHGGVLLLVKVKLKVKLLHGCFLRFLNCTNSTNLRNASRILLCYRRINSV